MLIVIVGLVLVVAVMASHPKLDQPGSAQQGLPQDTNIPAQGTNGVPSPGPAVTDNPIATTQRGMLSLGTNAGFLSPKFGQNRIAMQVSSEVISSTPQGPPDQSKSLDTQAHAQALTAVYDMPKSTAFRKL